ncbi:MAG: hypothetical protein KAS02_00985 [Candidatus Pacebacteria bacterium]|nr:hypothetical protein [Candidatus Paceibacterota bacterium]
MKKLILLVSLFIFFAMAILVSPVSAKQDKCATIPSGQIYDSAGNVIEVGYDQWGYNYQGRLFNGGYCDSYRGAAWCQIYADINLIMKWNDAWLSNKDCDGDGLLDRHFGYPNYIGSGAWLTNHQSGMVEVGGKMRQWNYFVKIVAVNPSDYAEDGYWYTQEGEEIGQVIWGQFAIIMQVSNDPSVGEHGVLYQSPVRVGLGNW